MTIVSGQFSAVGDNTGAKLMSGKIFVWLLAIVLLGTVAAEAQLPKKIPRIGYLMLDETPRETTRFEGIRLALRDFGYVDGQNITIEYRSAKG
jgi:putative ABC transport system substrate-binding protein